MKVQILGTWSAIQFIPKVNAILSKWSVVVNSGQLIFFSTTVN